MNKDTSEFLIIKLLAEGNDEAYKFLFRNHYAPLCHFAVQYLHDNYLAESVVSDVICHLWLMRDKLDIKTSLRSYLFKSVRNRCLDYMNEKHTIYNTRLNDGDTEQLEMRNFENKTEQPLGILIEKECENEIMDAVNTLPKECRRVFVMNRFEGRKYREIADELGISLNTVKYHMTNALSFMHKKLGKYLLLLIIFDMK